MFLNSLVGCLWGENKYDSLKNNTLRWADKISYTGNFILLEGKNVMIEGADADIATDTYDFTVQNTEQPFQVRCLYKLHSKRLYRLVVAYFDKAHRM